MRECKKFSATQILREINYGISSDLTKYLPFQVKDCSAKGQGMFALTDIDPGMIILREKPLIVMPDSIFQYDDMVDIEEWLDKKLLKLSSEDRAKFFELSDSRSEDPDEKTINGIFFTNDMNYIDDSAALFPVMARVNHACTPNADFITRDKLGKFVPYLGNP